MAEIAIPGGDAARSPLAAVAISAAVTISGLLPMFLTGALAVQMRPELGFDQAGLGIAIAVFLGSGSIAAIPGGRLTDRFGATVVMRTSASLAFIAAGMVAALARSWIGLLIALTIAGLANGLGQPASNVFLTRLVPGNQQGLAFGVKQSAAPAASLLGGLAVPALALTLGWRWAFAGAAVFALSSAFSVPKGHSGLGRVVSATTTGVIRLGPLLLLALGGAFGFAAASALTGFLVDASVLAGFGEGSAGLLLAFGSLLAVAARLWVGRGADRRQGGHLRAVAIMLGGGALGIGLLASQHHVSILVGTAIAFCLAWGWSGLFFYAIVRLNPDSPGTAAGIAQAGTFAGGIIGPIAFGAVAASWGYPPAWMLAASWSAAAGAAIGIAQSWDRRRRAATTPARPT